MESELATPMVLVPSEVVLRAEPWMEPRTTPPKAEICTLATSETASYRGTPVVPVDVVEDFLNACRSFA
jgi:hypothetical protein